MILMHLDQLRLLDLMVPPIPFELFFLSAWRIQGVLLSRQVVFRAELVPWLGLQRLAPWLGLQRTLRTGLSLRHRHRWVGLRFLLPCVQRLRRWDFLLALLEVVV